MLNLIDLLKWFIWLVVRYRFTPCLYIRSNRMALMRKCKQRLSVFLVQIDTDIHVSRILVNVHVSVANLSRLYTMDYSNLKTAARKGKIRGRKSLSLSLPLSAFMRVSLLAHLLHPNEDLGIYIWNVSREKGNNCAKIKRLFKDVTGNGIIYKNVAAYIVNQISDLARENNRIMLKHKFILSWIIFWNENYEIFIINMSRKFEKRLYN